MFINQIQLRNFKSFPSATIKLDKGFNCIVGPNGSGKCLKGDSQVLLADGLIKPIRQIVESALAVGDVTRLDDGLLTIDNNDGTAVFTLNRESGKVEARPVQAFVKRTSPEKLLEIRTASGKKVIVTACHPVMIRQGDGITAVRADELKAGIAVATAGKSWGANAQREANGSRSSAQISLVLPTLFWEAITSIKEVQSKEEWVYDLCVEENHNFLAEGIFVHNSNVVDGLLFAFAENRLRAMRVKKTSDLIFQNNKVAEVTVMLNEDGKAETQSVARLVKRDGKTKYVLNGRRTKKYAIEEFLAQHSLLLTNIIKQGEVQRIVEMDSKERRMLIDLVANVSEYEDKKKEAIGELNQAEQKLREAATIMNEREGYLRELEQEKNNAIRYKELKTRLDSLKATVLTIDLQEHEKEFEAIINSMLDAENKLAAVQSRIRELEQAINSRNAEKDEVNKVIFERSQGEEQQLQREIDALNIGVETSKRAIEEKTAALKELEEKTRAKKPEYTKAADEVKGASQQTGEVQKELASIAKILQEKTREYNDLLASSNKLSSGFQEARLFVERASEQMLAIKEQLSQLQAEAGKDEELARMKEKELNRIKSGEFIDYAPRKKELEEQRKQLAQNLKNAQQDLDALFERERKLNERVPVLEDLLLMAREKCAEIGARLRNAGDGGGKTAEALTALKEEEKGVLGSVEELCSYSNKYSLPVQVAFGSRLNFAVVDSVKTATRAIGFLKSRKLGRISFIPLDRINASEISREDRELAKRPGSLGFLIDFVEFDEKHRRAFEFICGNTLLMQDLKSAEPLVGRIRVVTMEGELSEASGLMTGGVFSPRASAASERKQLDEWEKKLEDARKEKEGAYEDLRALRDEMGEARKRKAEAELAFKACEIEGQHLLEREKSEREKKSHLVDAVEELEKEIKQLKTAVDAANEKRAELVRQLSELNTRSLDAKQRIDVEKEEAFGIHLKEREHAMNELRVQHAEYENRLAALQTQYSVYDRQAKAIEKELEETQEQEKQVSKQVNEASDFIKKARDELRQKTEQQKELGAKFKELLNKREKLEGDIARLGNEKGKMEFEREKLERGSQDERVKKAVLENTLTTLKAQLDEYKHAAVMEGKSASDKPELVALSKVAQDELESLGSVNLRAIELYGQRSQEFEEQKKRVEHLFNEKEAVIAVINEIEGKKINTFMNTYDGINANFKRVFSQIFQGEGTLFLENSVNPFEGGLTIQVKLENKEVKYLELMSGGEKALIALVFLFAIQSVNPSSVYILDEADAALDAENSRKLAQLIKALSRDTQFLVVTHNQNVYKQADMLVGVAMAKDGSRPVEVKLNE